MKSAKSCFPPRSLTLLLPPDLFLQFQEEHWCYKRKLSDYLRDKLLQALPPDFEAPPLDQYKYIGPERHSFVLALSAEQYQALVAEQMAHRYPTLRMWALAKVRLPLREPPSLQPVAEATP